MLQRVGKQAWDPHPDKNKVSSRGMALHRLWYLVSPTYYLELCWALFLGKTSLDLIFCQQSSNWLSRHHVTFASLFGNKLR
jgi:hypothetical protein